jgi:hypothetical protein
MVKIGVRWLVVTVRNCAVPEKSEPDSLKSEPDFLRIKTFSSVKYRGTMIRDRSPMFFFFL